jgi:hypothetical protein
MIFVAPPEMRRVRADSNTLPLEPEEGGGIVAPEVAVRDARLPATFPAVCAGDWVGVVELDAGIPDATLAVDGRLLLLLGGALGAEEAGAGRSCEVLEEVRPAAASTGAGTLLESGTETVRVAVMLRAPPSTAAGAEREGARANEAGVDVDRVADEEGSKTPWGVAIDPGRVSSSTCTLALAASEGVLPLPTPPPLPVAVGCTGVGSEEAGEAASWLGDTLICGCDVREDCVTVRRRASGWGVVNWEHRRKQFTAYHHGRGVRDLGCLAFLLSGHLDV